MAVVLARRLEGLRWVENSRPNNASRRHPMLVVRPLPIIQNRIQRRNLVRVRAYHTGTVTTDDDAITVIEATKLARMTLDAGLTDWVIRKAE